MFGLQRIMAITAVAGLMTVSGGLADDVQAATLVPMGNVVADETENFDSRTFEGSPVIAKFDWAVGGAGESDFSGSWPALGSDDFTVTFSDFDKSEPDDDPKTVTFSFDLSSIVLASGDTLGVRYITLKTGLTDQGWKFVDGAGDPTAVSIFSGSLTVTGQAISHITFWDTGVPPSAVIPLPAGGFLLITALGGFGIAARRRRKAA